MGHFFENPDKQEHYTKQEEQGIIEEKEQKSRKAEVRVIANERNIKWDTYTMIITNNNNMKDYV